VGDSAQACTASSIGPSAIRRNKNGRLGMGHLVGDIALAGMLLCTVVTASRALALVALATLRPWLRPRGLGGTPFGQQEMTGDQRHHCQAAGAARGW
jgi:hypothetical protein